MIFIYNRDEKQIAHLDIIPKITEEIGKLRTLEFESEEEFEKGYRVVAKTNDGVFEFIIVDSDYSRDDIKIFSYFCQDSLIETQSIPILDKRPWGNVEVVSKAIFGDTRWVVEVRNGYNMSTIFKNSYYHITVLEAFSEMVEKYRAEWITEFKVVGNEITERRVVLYQRDGRSLGRLEFGKNITKFTRRVLSEPIVTALYVYGKGEDLGNGTYGRRINISSVNGGKEYIENIEATQKYGIGKSGQKKALFGFMIFEEETDPSNLLKLGKQELEILSQVRAEYTVNAINLDIEAKIGYEVAVIDEEIGYRGFSRIIKIARQGDDVELTFGTVTKKFVDSVQKTLKKNEQNINDAFVAINNVRTSADGKTRVFTGPSEPENASNGDMWYRENPNGTVDILILKDGDWAEHISDKVFKALKQDLEKSKEIIEEATQNTDEEIKKVKKSISSLDNGLTQKYNRLESSLETYVKEEALISGIKQRAGNIFLFSSDEKRINGINITPTNTYIANGVIKTAHIKDASITNAKIASIRAEKITAGTIDFNKIRGINIDANNISTGTISSGIFRTSFNNVNNIVTIDGSGMTVDGKWGGKILFNNRGLTFIDKLANLEMGSIYGLYRLDSDPLNTTKMGSLGVFASYGYGLALGLRNVKEDTFYTFQYMAIDDSTYVIRTYANVEFHHDMKFYGGNITGLNNLQMTGRLTGATNAGYEYNQGTNGAYIRFNNGLKICWHKMGYKARSNGWEGWAFPIRFDNPPTVTASLYRGQMIKGATAYPSVISTYAANITVSDTNSEFNINVMAIGF